MFALNETNRTQQAEHNVKEAKRKGLRADDVEKAINDLDILEFLQPALKQHQQMTTNNDEGGDGEDEQARGQ